VLHPGLAATTALHTQEEALSCAKGPTKETYKRDLQKRPTKESPRTRREQWISKETI